MKLINKIKEGLEYIMSAEWYNGTDLGDGILVSFITSSIIIYGSIIGVLVLLYYLIF